jgi:hypothetical protein
MTRCGHGNAMYSMVYYRIDKTDSQTDRGIVIERNQMYINNNLMSTRLLFLSFNPLILIMSRPQGHRKSQSTSALNVLAASTSTSTSTSTSGLNQSTATPRSRRTQGSTRLGSVVEDDSEREERSHAHAHSHLNSTSHIHEDSKEGLEGLLGMISSRTPRKERHHDKGKSADALGEEDLRAAVNDVSNLIFKHQSHLSQRLVLMDQIRSLRSSERRRLAALRNIERIFVSTCAGLSSITMATLVAAECKSDFCGSIGMLTSSTHPTHSTLDTPRTDPLA